MVCVVGRMRDLILQLSKSSIYSTKPHYTSVNTDGNVIDFVVFGILHGLSTKWYLVPVVAAIWFAVYYGIFRFAITRFNLKTPGRDIDTATSVEQAVAGTVGKPSFTSISNGAFPSRRFRMISIVCTMASSLYVIYT